MPFQRVQTAPTGQIPEPHGPIVTAGDCQQPVGTQTNWLYPLCGENVQAAPATYLPQPYSFIPPTASGDSHSPVGAQSHCGHHIGMSFQRVQTTFFFNDTATTEIYTLSLHDAAPPRTR